VVAEKVSIYYQISLLCLSSTFVSSSEGVLVVHVSYWGSPQVVEGLHLEVGVVEGLPLGVEEVGEGLHQEGEGVVVPYQGVVGVQEALLNL